MVLLCMPCSLQVSSMYTSAPDMRTDEGELLRRIGDTYIITGDIYCNTHTNVAARSAAGCAVQVRGALLQCSSTSKASRLHASTVLHKLRTMLGEDGRQHMQQHGTPHHAPGLNNPTHLLTPRDPCCSVLACHACMRRLWRLCSLGKWSPPLPSCGPRGIMQSRLATWAFASSTTWQWRRMPP